MPPPGGTQTRGTRAKRDNAPEGGTQGEAVRNHNERGDLTKWQKMKGILKDITESLVGVIKVEVREEIRSKVILTERVADAIYGQAASQAQNMIIKIIKEMDKKVDALVNKAGTQKGRSWAEVVAGNPPGILLLVQRLVIRVRLPEAQGKSPPEFLEVVKPV